MRGKVTCRVGYSWSVCRMSTCRMHIQESNICFEQMILAFDSVHSGPWWPPSGTTAQTADIFSQVSMKSPVTHSCKASHTLYSSLEFSSGHVRIFSAVTNTYMALPHWTIAESWALRLPQRRCWRLVDRWQSSVRGNVEESQPQWHMFELL